MRAGLYGTMIGHVVVDSGCLKCSGTGLKLYSLSQTSCAVRVCECVSIETGFGPARYTQPRTLQPLVTEEIKEQQ